MGGIEQIYEKMGVFLVERLRLDQPGRGKQELRQELDSLRAVSDETVRSYYVKKVSKALMIVTAGLVLAVVSFLAYAGRQAGVEGQRLARPDYGEGDRREALAVQIDGEEVQKLEVTVQERRYTDQEIQELTDRAIAELERLLPGENTSLDEVRRDLVLPERLADGAVKASWMTVPYGVIDESGRLLGSEDEDGVLVELQGTLTCCGKETLYTAYARVFPRELSEEERLRQSILDEVREADEEGSYGTVLELPKAVGDRGLYWLRREENPFFKVLAFSVIAAAIFYLEMDSQVHSRAEKRKEQLLLDYPDLLWRMTMLLGAGLGIKATFVKIAEQYLKEQGVYQGKGRKKRRAVRYVYEEIAFACYEMQSGVPEAEAYERFGRRCQLPEYIRLGTVLAQNLKKGAKGLTALLETEAASSFTERKNNARKMSEKAGTKLLLPMVLMLGVVLVVLMVPAFLSF